MKVLLIGGGGREHAIAGALKRTGGVRLYAIARHRNPGVARLCEEYLEAGETDVERAVLYARMKGIELAVVGPEAPLEKGIADELERAGVAVFGPRRAAARIETSKAFMRELMRKHRVPGGVEWNLFGNVADVGPFMERYPKEVVVKPVGLTGGKGVKMAGEQLLSKADVVAYASEIFDHRIGGDPKVLIEEKLDGEEFTLQCMTDGRTVLPMPAVQDHKRALDGDAGPNTGGMGSYSCADGLLPFLKREEVEAATAIVRKTVAALREEEAPFRGVLYGQFMLTAEGPKVVEFNARFGDPEAMNVLPLYDGDFADACLGAARGELGPRALPFRREATVCRYLVPPGYGFEPKAGVHITVDEEGVAKEGARLFYAAVNRVGEEGGCTTVSTTTSRAVGVVGLAPDLEGANGAVERALTHIKGDYFARRDIGTHDLIRKRVEHMEILRGTAKA